MVVLLLPLVALFCFVAALVPERLWVKAFFVGLGIVCLWASMAALL
jgi:hypothetical protein